MADSKSPQKSETTRARDEDGRFAEKASGSKKSDSGQSKKDGDKVGRSGSKSN